MSAEFASADRALATGLTLIMGGVFIVLVGFCVAVGLAIGWLVWG